MKGWLFTPENIKAIVDLRKTQTRRLESSLKEINKEPDDWKLLSPINIPFIFRREGFWDYQDLRVNPRYHVGETVYVKESHYRYGTWTTRVVNNRRDFIPIEDTFKIRYFENPPDHYYKQNEKYALGYFKRSPLFLPAESARHFQKVSAVDAQRLQEITEEDAIAEGIYFDGEAYRNPLCQMPFATARDAYISEWNIINPDHPFENNEWVFGYKFILCDREGK